MREAVTISYCSRILPSPLGLYNDLTTSIYFLRAFNFYFFGLLFLEPMWAMVTRPVQGPVRGMLERRLASNI